MSQQISASHQRLAWWYTKNHKMTQNVSMSATKRFHFNLPYVSVNMTHHQQEVKTTFSTIKQFMEMPLLKTYCTDIGIIILMHSLKYKSLSNSILN